MKRKPYEISDLIGKNLVKVWAAASILEMLTTLNFVGDINIVYHLQPYALVEINPLYEAEEAWLALVEALDEFTAPKVELDPDVWGQL